MEHCIAILGLGYVGLPIAIHFSRYYKVIAYDPSAERIAQLKKQIDYTQEISSRELATTTAFFTEQESDLQRANFYIVTVPTPINEANQPELSCLKQATKTIAKFLKPNDMVVYESTVYPGTTEEVCIPLLESRSQLHVGQDFFVGYSPERINPGDKEHTFDKVVKIISANNQEALSRVRDVYQKVVKNLYLAPSIKTAEAAKIIENTQRDLNVALMNELSIIFDRLGIDTQEVLSAAKTKWNFCDFTPGLVGGHCIGVDPYYLTYKAQTVGYHPEVILAGRRINDSMGKYVASQIVKKMLCAGIYSSQSKIGLLGLTFKANCSDIRNSKVFDIIQELKSYGLDVLIHDPLVDKAHVQSKCHINVSEFSDIKQVDVLIIAVNHRFYEEMSLDEFVKTLNPRAIIVDIKGILDPIAVKQLGIELWRL